MGLGDVVSELICENGFRGIDRNYDREIRDQIFTVCLPNFLIFHNIFPHQTPLQPLLKHPIIARIYKGERV